MRRAALWLTVLVAVLALTAGCSSRAQRLYRRAEAYFAEGKYELAAADYSALLRQTPGDALAPHALHKLAYLYRQEFEDPASAVALYERLAEAYPDSPFAAEALVWIVYLQARRLADPAATLRACQMMDERLPERVHLRARARLQLARVYQQHQMHNLARSTLEEVIARFGEDRDSVAEARYRLALLTRDALQEPERAAEMLEEVIADYADTAAASRARQALGWQYYALATAEQKERQAALAELARTVSAPAFSSAGPPSLQLLEALRALLAQAGVQTSLDELMVVTGLAFQFALDGDQPAKTVYFARNPLTQAAEAWGFGYNAWTFRSAEEALLPLATSLRRNRPALLLFGGDSPQWCLFVGYQPQQQQVLVLRPGQSGPSRLSEEQFRQGWPRRPGARLFPALPDSGYQFALTEQATRPSRVQVLREATLRAGVALEQPELMGSPAGRQAYQTLAERLATLALNPQERAVAQTRRFAEQGVPHLVRARRAAATVLESLAEQMEGPAAQGAGQAARRYAEFAERWQALGQDLLAAAENSSDPAGWNAARAGYASLAADEQQALQNLVAALGG